MEPKRGSRVPKVTAEGTADSLSNNHSLPCPYEQNPDFVGGGGKPRYEKQNKDTLHFPASFAGRNGHVTTFWPMRCKWKLLGVTLRKSHKRV